jgi:hypothetical protein
MGFATCLILYFTKKKKQALINIYKTIAKQEFLACSGKAFADF